MHPYAIFDYMGAFLRSSFAHVDYPRDQNNHMAAPGSLQGNKPHQNSPEPSEPCLRNLRNPPPQPTPFYTGTLRDPSGTCLPEPTPAHAGLRNLHHFTPELSGTFRNRPPAHAGTLRPPEPAPAARTGTHRSLSGLKTPLAYAVGEKISFGGIPNSSSIDILMPYAIFDLSRLQRNKPHGNLPEPSQPCHQQAGTFPQSCLRNLHQHTPELSASGTFQDLLRQPTPAYTGTLQNLPEPSGTGPQNRTYTILHRNSPEPSGTCLRNLHQHTPELSGTFRNPPPEPTPAYAGTFRNSPHAGTLRNLPEPSSGTCSCDPHRHTPELIWAEDPISLRCWGKKTYIL